MAVIPSAARNLYPLNRVLGDRDSSTTMPMRFALGISAQNDNVSGHIKVEP